MAGFGVVIRVGTEEHAKKMAVKISHLMDEARMLPIPVDVYKFEGYPDLRAYIVG